jgi:MoxR-like ATPase
LINQRKGHPIEGIAEVVDGKELLALRDAVTSVHVDPSLLQYILAIVGATRAHAEIALGASPRGSLALYKTAQALASLQGRDYVKPDDIKLLAPLTLAHRLIVKPESQLRGRTARRVLDEILEQTPLELER